MNRHVRTTRVDRRRRRGSSLIETVQVIALVGLLLSLSSIVLGNAIRVHHSAMAGYRELTSMDRFVQRWRTDAELSEQLVTEAAADGTSNWAGIEFQQAGRIIRYRFADGLVSRIAVDKADGTETRDNWELPTGSTLSFQLRESTAEEDRDAVAATDGSPTSKPILVARLTFPETIARPALEWLTLCRRLSAASSGGDVKEKLESAEEVPL